MALAFSYLQRKRQLLIKVLIHVLITLLCRRFLIFMTFKALRVHFVKCVYERERERVCVCKREIECECVCVCDREIECVCVCVRERERD